MSLVRGSDQTINLLQLNDPVDIDPRLAIFA